MLWERGYFMRGRMTKIITSFIFITIIASSLSKPVGAADNVFSFLAMPE